MNRTVLVILVALGALTLFNLVLTAAMATVIKVARWRTRGQQEGISGAFQMVLIDDRGTRHNACGVCGLEVRSGAPRCFHCGAVFELELGQA